MLGGQANVEGVSGVWKELTDNFNQLATSLTTQVRAIADVSTAVTEGDLTRQVTVDAKGEVDALKQNVNQMIANLRQTTERNAEQDWLNSNLARFSGMMQGQRDLQTVSRLIMSELTPLVGAGYGAFFLAEEVDDDEPELQLIASYGYKTRKKVSNRFKLGESLVGQAALERQSILITRAAGGLRQGRVRPRRGRAEEHHRHAGPLRGPGDGRDRARVVPAVQRGAARLPRPARRDDRHRHQHDPGDDAHRGAAPPVAGPHASSCRSARRSSSRSRRS